MSNSNYTTDTEKFQHLFGKLGDDFPNLIPKIESAFSQINVLQRKRKIKSAFILFLAIIYYAMTKASFRTLSATFALNNIVNVSDTAWRKKFKASSCLRSIYNDLVGQILTYQCEQTSYHKQVYLVDCSSIKEEGTARISYRIHTSYCLTQKCVAEIKVTDHHCSESFSNFEIHADGIYIADAGYCRTKQFEHIANNNADFIIRFSPHNANLYDKDSNKLKLVDMLNKYKGDTFELKAYTSCKQMLPVRIIAVRLSAKNAATALAKVRDKARKNQTKQTSQAAIDASKWLILITTLSDEYKAQQVLDIYRLRWQVELFFKRMKQFLGAHSIRKSTQDYAMTLIYAWLLIWLITEREALQLQLALEESGVETETISFWRLCDMSTRHFKSIVDELTSGSEKVPLNAWIKNTLSSPPRKRKNQLQTDIQRLLSTQHGFIY